MIDREIDVFGDEEFTNMTEEHRARVLAEAGAAEAVAEGEGAVGEDASGEAVTGEAAPGETAPPESSGVEGENTPPDAVADADAQERVDG
jgi:hypothetical protein